jgi:hypothetical protein
MTSRVDSDNNIIVSMFYDVTELSLAKPLFGNFRGGTDDIFITKFKQFGYIAGVFDLLRRIRFSTMASVCSDSSNNIYIRVLAAL